MANYEQIDAAIVARITERPRAFSDLWPHLDGIAEQATAPVRGDGYRIIDRRLQSLRKRGLIVYRAGMWRLPE